MLCPGITIKMLVYEWGQNVNTLPKKLSDGRYIRH